MHRNAGQRGGALFQEGAGAIADLRNTLVYSNASTMGYGAGIRSEGGTVTMTHVTLAHNENGAGYSHFEADGYVQSSIAWGNEVGGFWLDGGSLTGTCSIDQSGRVGEVIDPQFVNPGAGENYRVHLGSPAVDRCSTGLPDDITGAGRPRGLGYDAGAFEHAYSAACLPLVERQY
jgi:hypothetical protein